MNTIILLLGLTILSLFYTIFAKEYIITNKKRCILYIILIEIIMTIGFIKLLSRHNLGTIYSVLTCLSIILLTFISIFIYKECINLKMILGIMCAIIAIVLLSLDIS
jgi:multidrug transporter EmrE-like cation transporter